MSCKVMKRLLVLLIVICCINLIIAHEHSHDGNHHHSHGGNHHHSHDDHGHSHDENPSFKYSRKANEEVKPKVNHHGHSHDHEEVPKAKPIVSSDTPGYFRYLLIFTISIMSFSYHYNFRWLQYMASFHRLNSPYLGSAVFHSLLCSS